MKKMVTALVMILLLLLTIGVLAQDEDEDPVRVWFSQPTSNAIVPRAFEVVMNTENFIIESWENGVNEGAGHFHILVDVDFVEAGQIIPSDPAHHHYGNGETTAKLILAPGVHILRLQIGDGTHRALEGDEYRDEIVVRVEDDAPAQSVRFVTPSDGAIVPPNFTVTMAASGMEVAPAEAGVQENSGHMHILINEEFVPAGEVIPANVTNRHFGGGQTQTELALEPGEYTLRLQYADALHTALDGDQYRDEITVTVSDEAPEQSVMFIGIEDGATVSSPVMLQWAVNGLIVEPAGRVNREGAGHLHVLINTDFIPAGEVIPADEAHRHFGGGQMMTELDIEPGEYTLRLQMADGEHTAFEGDQYRDEITITVE